MTAPMRLGGAPGWLAKRVGPLLTLAGSLTLLVSLWLPWIDVASPCIQARGEPLACPIRHFSGWEVFRYGDIVLAALAGVAIWLTLFGPQLAALIGPRVGVEARLARALSWLGVSACGWVALSVSLYAIHRPILEVRVAASAPAIGYFATLVASGAILGGAWWATYGARAERSGAEFPDP
jgi:hypothetical protein